MNFVRDIGVKTIAQAPLKASSTTILAGMERKHHHASRASGTRAGCAAGFPSAENSSSPDAQTPEHAGTVRSDSSFAQRAQRGADGIAQFARRGKLFPARAGRVSPRGVRPKKIREHFSERRGIDLLQEGGGGLAALRVHPHVSGRRASRRNRVGSSICIEETEVGEDESAPGNILPANMAAGPAVISR